MPWSLALADRDNGVSEQFVMWLLPVRAQWMRTRDTASAFSVNLNWNFSTDHLIHEVAVGLLSVCPSF